MIEEKRIYVVVAGTIQVPVSLIFHGEKILPDLKKGLRTVVQPAGRQIAQACHVVSKLRHRLTIGSVDPFNEFKPATTIILQARDSSEMGHVYTLWHKKKLDPVMFSDTNEQAYGRGDWPTAIAVLATSKQVWGLSDYLPLWGAQ